MNQASFLAFASRGLALRDAVAGQVVTVTLDPSTDPPTTLALTGIVSEVELDPGQLEQFGYRPNQIFQLRVSDSNVVDTVKIGMFAVAPTGEACKFIHYRRSRFGVLLFFGSINR